MRVLHLPSPTGGNAAGLSRALRDLGIDSEVWVFRPSPYDYPADRTIAPAATSALRAEFKRLRALRYVFDDIDVVHFNFGTTLFNVPVDTFADGLRGRVALALARTYFRGMQFVELEVLRHRRIAMFVHFQGDDARQGEYCRTHFEISTAQVDDPRYYTPRSDANKRATIRRLARYCARIYAVNPDLLHVLPAAAEFVPYTSVFPADVEPAFTRAAGDPLRVAHAPSHRGVKGTDRVIDAVARLCAEGVRIELDLIEGLTHEEALTRYAKCDVLVDQLLAGWYGGVAVEAMALGKPVVAYIRDDDLRLIPPQMREDLPIVRTTCATLEDDLRALAELPAEDFHALARDSRRFVERWHDPHAIAEGMLRDYHRAAHRVRTCGSTARRPTSGRRDPIR
jgi:glycosyltransferase involved in cell wall biosynthesis